MILITEVLKQNFISWLWLQNIQDTNIEITMDTSEGDTAALQENKIGDHQRERRSCFIRRCYSEPIVYSDFIPTISFKTKLENRSSNNVFEFSSTFFESTKSWIPFQFLNLFHILPTEEDISKELETEQTPQKFSEIDIASRTYFPLSFTFLLSFYFILYIYIIEDEIPISLYN